MRNRCTSAGLCDAHRDGAAKKGEPCPWYCDAPDCRRKAAEEPFGDGRSFCRAHAATATRGRGRPRGSVTTGSRGAAPVSFRLGAAERSRALALAAGRGQTVGELARRALLAELDRG